MNIGKSCYCVSSTLLRCTSCKRSILAFVLCLAFCIEATSRPGRRFPVLHNSAGAAVGVVVLYWRTKYCLARSGAQPVKLLKGRVLLFCRHSSQESLNA
jgi:hypothetical protein